MAAKQKQRTTRLAAILDTSCITADPKPLTAEELKRLYHDVCKPPLLDRRIPTRPRRG